MILETRWRHVFGPVPSRRLGRSLGIDLVPFKTCSYNCIYCQLGRTTNKTIERGEYVPLAGVLSELQRKLALGPGADYITLSGSGEPTLYSELESLIRGIKHQTDRPVAVLTNGSLLWDPDVQESLLEADLVIPSLDAGDEAMFQRVNRPHPAVSFERMLAGLERFRQRFPKPMWLEVLLLKGLTATTPQVEKIGRLVKRISPDRVQLNTATRPPSEDFAAAVPLEELEQAARATGGRAEVIADNYTAQQDESYSARREEILNLLMRRPCTPRDVATGLGLNPNEVAKHLDELIRAHVLVCRPDGEQVYYRYAARTGNEGSPASDSNDRVVSQETQGE